MRGLRRTVLVVCRMSEHILPKDSGWQLKSEPKEGEALELDEEPSEGQLGLGGYMG